MLTLSLVKNSECYMKISLTKTKDFRTGLSIAFLLHTFTHILSLIIIKTPSLGS